MSSGNVLHVVAQLDPRLGGVSQAVCTMARGLNRLGIHNEVVCLNEKDSSFLKHHDFIIHALGNGRGPWTYNPQLIPWLRANVSRFRVILVHGLWLFPSFAVNYVTRKSLRSSTNATHLPKTFVLPHGMLDPYFQRAKDRRLKALRNMLYWNIIEKKVINNATGLLFTCEEERRLARIPFAGYKPRNELVAGIGLEPPPPSSATLQDAFLKVCPELRKGNFLLFLGRIDKKKGLDLLLKAYARFVIERLSSAGNNNKQAVSIIPALVIAGPGIETSYGKFIRGIVDKEPHIKNFVFFPGMLTGDTKWGALYACSAFVLTSHQENFGIAIAEALACRKPVLITNKINIWGEIDRAGAGLVSDPSAGAVLNMLKHWDELYPEEKDLMAGNGLSLYHRAYTVESATLRLLQLID